MNEGRRYIVQGLIFIVALIFLIKLFFIQVLDSNYRLAAENNIVQKIVEYPYRGLIYDRHGKLLVYNNPIYDLMVVPKEVAVSDTTDFCNFFSITKEEFESKIAAARRYSYIKPSKFIGQLSNLEFAKLQDKLIKYKGFYVLARTVRSYPQNTLANALGYVGEINRRQLRRDTTGYYRQGDFIGISGIEREYEDVLRGKRGVSYKMVNVRGVEKGAFKDGSYDTLSIPGVDLTSTIDSELQQYAEYLFEGKTGSVAAIEPSTGEILALVSGPSYDPNLLSGREFSENFNNLQSDTLKPLFDRPLMAMYPPGSMFKTVQSLVALQEGVVTPEEQIYSDGRLIGDLAPNGYYDVKRAIRLSSNNYFYKVFRRVINQNQDDNTYLDARIGLEKWKSYINNFGLGVRLPTDLPTVKSGYVPGIEYYDRMYGTNRWKFSNIYSLSIGQGEVLVTPLQMANLGATLANRGYYYAPHIIKSIDDEGTKRDVYKEPIWVGIDSVHYPIVIDGMEEVIQFGSGRRAFIKDIAICGKTSTVENSQGADHSGFMGFAPKENPQIAIAVYVENSGWGGRAAASIASLLMEHYIRGEITRPWLEDFVLKGDFLY